MNHAITGNIRNLFLVLKAAKRFKTALLRKRPGLLSMFDQNSNIVAPPGAMNPLVSEMQSFLGSKRAASKHSDSKLTTLIHAFSIHDDVEVDDTDSADLTATEVDIIVKQQLETQNQRPATGVDTEAHRHAVPGASDEDIPASRTHINAEDHAKGHAHDPLEDRLYLQIGCDPNETEAGAEHYIVSESPSATDGDVYEQAYRNEMDRIVKENGQNASLFMNRRVDDQDDIRRHRNIVDAGKSAAHYASDKFTALSARGYSAGMDASDAGRDKARSAINTLSTTDWRAEIDNRKQGAKDAVSSGVERGKSAAQVAADLAAPTAKKAANAFSGIVSKAQSKHQGDSNKS